ncbi:hypothetical protein DQ04_01981070 [Trypanosoma grayi]|uniref:hypothetical protein n=1 Tax=Trypanosoma grayi TaxID=71804 RepID=UPI0004F44E99|nr:hypothetical protein DQ04_01981070 [Trypanosoma grayi]KEG12126.1 hypothetical protein DQ04_01981070 [Trypanosoma grayi]
MIDERLPLFRAKLPGLYAGGGTGPEVGPGSYDLTFNSSQPGHGVAPFNTTSDRFAPHQTAASPGVGTYNIITENQQKGDISIVPFASTVDRFFGPRADDVPGPGEYNHDGDRWGRTGRSYTVGKSHPEGFAGSASGSPGVYYPNYTSGCRAHPRAANFAKYSSREPPRFNDVPGPGHYDVSDSGNALYDRKPTSMFATKTMRSMIGGASKNPGPGAYDIPAMFQTLEQYRNENPENFSAFGSSAPRDKRDWRDNEPGPGAYTGEIAPRRPRAQCKGKGTSSFVSGSERNRLPMGTNLGPGAYGADKPAKMQKYELASVPFRSTLSRFPISKLPEETGVFEARHPVVRVPRRIHPARVRHETFARSTGNGPVNPSTDRVYDVKYDWPKPSCTSGAYLGTAPRFKNKDLSNSYPGPGHYDVAEKVGSGGSRFMNTTWGTDGRFKRDLECNPGPGHYSYNSTLLTKTFNCTFGSSDDL